jgi:hypothetical protein
VWSEETKTCSVWNVSIVETPDSNGYCVSFDNAADAEKLAEWAKNEGCWHVSLWK